MVLSSLQDEMQGEEHVGVGDTELVFSPRASGGAGQWAVRSHISAMGSRLETELEVGGDRSQVWG